jgi:hypothetical protein
MTKLNLLLCESCGAEDMRRDVVTVDGYDIANGEAVAYRPAARHVTVNFVCGACGAPARIVVGDGLLRREGL